MPRLLLSLMLMAALAMAWSGSASAKPDKQDEVATHVAERTGALVYAYDQAAWHSTDKFMAEMKSKMPANMRGYIVVPDQGNRLRAIYYAEDGDKLVAIRSYSVAGKRSIQLLTAETGSPLSPLTLRMIAARDAALRFASDNALPICAKASPNTVVLPPNENDQISVYVLTPQVENGQFPAGGHYRFVFDNQNQLLTHRKFAEGCELITVKQQGFGIIILDHKMDDHPTEIHAFLSRSIPFPMTIVTPKRDVWFATNGKLEYTSRLKPQE